MHGKRSLGAENELDEYGGENALYGDAVVISSAELLLSIRDPGMRIA
jgi:hypothetical protein